MKLPSPALLAAAFLLIMTGWYSAHGAAPGSLPEGAQDVRIFYRPTVFPGAKLARPLPTRVIAGALLQISGVTKSSGHDTVTAVIRYGKNGENGENGAYGEKGRQMVIRRPMRGNSFSLNVHFPRPGTAFLGLLFDDGKKSPVVRIDVRPEDRTRVLPPPSFPPLGSLGVEARYADAAVLVYWLSDPKRVTRLRLEQAGPGTAKGRTKRFYLDGDAHQVVLDPQYMRTFRPGTPLQLTLSQAASKDGSALGRSSAWVDIDAKTVHPVIGYSDRTSDVMQTAAFPRLLRPGQRLRARLSINKPDVTLREHAYVILPNGFVKPVPMQRSWRNGLKGRDRRDPRDQRTLSFTYAAEKPGAHIFQIFSSEGRIELSRTVYVTDTDVLPMLPAPRPDIVPADEKGIVRWVNAFRERHGLGSVRSDGALDRFAASYARRIAGSGVLSHGGPARGGLRQRALSAGLNLPLGENLAAGPTLEDAAQGLTTSALHRANLLRPEWSRLGVGVKRDAQGKYYLVQVFAR